MLQNLISSGHLPHAYKKMIKDDSLLQLCNLLFRNVFVICDLWQYSLPAKLFRNTNNQLWDYKILVTCSLCM